ncbi:putative ABC transport system substrate-binding protein [Candidatus Electrothrix communis]|uniref:Putative ABC transport system substrate-binding protein n=1 Tax=Candidatus Electrothrix communis TaxID=1859133 RepID=A0A3S3U7A3_9BACT|nr:putative ABC transport system substrate-binding protein [Candidatus Electrothrix communis]
MNKYLLLIIISFFSLAGRAVGYEIVVLKSSTSKINQQIQNIFIDEFDKRSPQRGLKSIQPNQMTEVVITRGDEEGCASKIQSIHPDLILALGAQALKIALLVPDIPVVHLLVIRPVTITDTIRPVTGVSLSVPPKVQLDEMTRYFPEVKRVGLVYDPKRSSKIIEQLQAARPDLEFITLPTENISEVPELIHSLRGKVDFLWMLPDLTATNQMTIQSYVLFSIRNKIPLLTFSQKLLTHGATIAVTFDTDEMAKQAAALAIDMLFHPVGAEQTALVDPPVKTIINHTMTAKLGISIADRKEADE